MLIKRLTAAFAAIALVLAACTPPGSATLQVTSYSPIDGATGVSVDAVVTATFSAAIDEDTVEGNFELASSGGAVDGVVSYDAATRTATFTPDDALAYDTVYTVTVDGSVATAGGVTLGGDASWSFTTEANPVVDAIGGIDVTPAAAGLLVGETVQLDAELTGVTGTPDEGVTWSSGNEAVATVSATGLVTAVAQGTAVITATSDFDTSVSDTATISVALVPAVASVSVTPEAPTVEVGDTVQLTADVVTIGAATDAVTWSSGNESVATVSTSGLVTAQAEGTAVITATSDFDGSVSDFATVTVVPVPAVDSVTVTPESETLLVGQTVQLTADVVAIGSATDAVTWSSGNEAVATVSTTGLVTAEGEGTAVITATSDFDGAVSDFATITVYTELLGSAYADGGALVDTALTDLLADVSGGATPYAFATSDALPAGVTLDATTGTIAGTPTETGLFTGTVTATDDIGQTVDLDFSIEVVAVLEVTAFLDATEDAGTTIAPLTVVTTGGLAPFTFEIVTPEPFPAPNGPLAPGLALDEATGVLTGTLAEAGFFSSVILTTDALGQTAETLVEIEVFLVLTYAGSPYDYTLGCGGLGTTNNCPANDEVDGNQDSYSAITPFADIQVIGSQNGNVSFTMTRVGGGNSLGWAISSARGVIFRSNQGTISGVGNTSSFRNGNRTYQVRAYDEDTGEEAFFNVVFNQL